MSERVNQEAVFIRLVSIYVFSSEVKFERNLKRNFDYNLHCIPVTVSGFSVQIKSGEQIISIKLSILWNKI